jgi:flagellar basal body-associated protein FliL
MGATSNGRLPRVIPWIIIAVIAVPLAVAAFVATRRNTAATELPPSSDAAARAEQEFAAAEAYEAKWHEEDKERFHQERLP